MPALSTEGQLLHAEEHFCSEQLPFTLPGAAVYGTRWKNEVILQHRAFGKIGVFMSQISGRVPSILEARHNLSAIVLHISLDGPLEYELEGLGKIQLQERSISCYYVPFWMGHVRTGRYDNQSLFVCLAPQALETLAGEYLQVGRLLDHTRSQRACLLLQQPRIAPYEVLTQLKAAVQDSNAERAAKRLASITCRIIENMLSQKRPHIISLEADEIDQVYAARDYIRENIHRMLTAEELESATGLTEWKRRSWFPMIFGVGLTRYSTQIRMECAETMLLAGEKTASIAQALGYSCADAFRYTFKKHFGTLPSQHFDKFNGRLLMSND